MSPRVAALQHDVRRRARRTMFGMVFLGCATIILGAAVGWSIAVNYSQDDQLQAYSACAERPKSIECRVGHANSVALTTPSEACFILAQGGKRCSAPLPESGAIRRALLASVAETEGIEVVVDDGRITVEPSSPSPADPDTSPSSTSGTSNQAVPRPPRTPNTPAPTKPPAPAAPSPEPAPPAQPAKQAPVVDAPDQLGLCVNALGVRVIC